MVEIQLDTQQVLDSAGELFEGRGFADTTLADIATHAEIPLDVLEAAYDNKLHIALAIYHQLGARSLDQVAELSASTISERYFSVLEAKLAQLDAYPETVSTLFASAMHPRSAIQPADISPGLRDPMMQVMHQLIDGADDRPARDTDEMALFLYAFHFLVIIFWLYDRTADKQASHLLTNFLREFVKLSRPMMVMPIFTRALNKIAKIMMVVFGGARLVDPNENR